MPNDGDKRAAMIFAPNPTGPLHIGNALIFWATACKATRRNALVYVRIDDRWEPGQSAPPAAVQSAAIDSIWKTADLLGIEISMLYRFSERLPRYERMIADLVDDGLAIECGPGEVAMSHIQAHDILHGWMRKAYLWLERQGVPFSTLAMAADSWDYNVPLHVRGFDLAEYACRELDIFKAIGLLYGGYEHSFPSYMHVPLLADADGKTLRKSTPHARGYHAEVWARQFGNAEDRRAALDRLLSDVHRTRSIRIDTRANEICRERVYFASHFCAYSGGESNAT